MPKVKLLDLMVSACLVVSETAKLFFRVAVPFYVLLQWISDAAFHILARTRVFCHCFYFSHFERCAAISDGGFHLPFP